MKSGLLATFLCATLAFGWTARFLRLVGEIFFGLLFCDCLWVDVFWDTNEIAAAWTFDVWTIGAFNYLNFAPIGNIGIAFFNIKWFGLFECDSIWVEFFS